MQMDKINEYVQLAFDETVFFLSKIFLADHIFCLMILGGLPLKPKKV